MLASFEALEAIEKRTPEILSAECYRISNRTGNLEISDHDHLQ